MSIVSVNHEKVEIVITIEGFDSTSWYSWTVKTRDCSLTGTANTVNQSIRMIRRRLRKVRMLTEDIINR